MFENNLTDGNICELWKKYFPKRHRDEKAKFACEVLRQVVEQRAAHTGAQEKDLLFELSHVLDTIGIPREEFYQVEREAEDS
jgi:hypothetical protein